jgi:hypothetical protein
MSERVTPEMMSEWKRLTEAATPLRECGMYGAETWYSVLDAAGDVVATEIDRAEDAEFYLAARTAMPALLVECERLAEELGEARDLTLVAEVVQLRTETERLAALLPLARAAMALTPHLRVERQYGPRADLVCDDMAAMERLWRALNGLSDDLRAELEAGDAD